MNYKVKLSFMILQPGASKGDLPEKYSICCITDHLATLRKPISHFGGSFMHQLHHQ